MPQALTTEASSSYSLFEELFEQLGSAVAIYAPTEAVNDFRFVAMNRMAQALGGVSIEDIRGQRLTDVFPGAGAVALRDCLIRVHNSGMAESLAPFRYSDEHLKEGWYRNDVFRLDSGHIVAIYTDVTADIREQAALHESETRYQLLTESLAEGIYDWDTQGDAIYLSPSLKAQLGYRDEEFPNRLSRLLQTAHPDQQEQISASIQAFLESTDKLWDMEYQLQHKAGHYVWIRSRGTALRDTQTGKTLRVLGVHVDIDREKRAREESEHRRKTLNALFQALPDLFFLIDRNGLILDYQAADQSHLYRPPAAFLGKRMIDVLPADIANGLSAALEEALQQGTLTSLDYALPIDGREEFFECRIAPIEADRAALIARNVTARKQAERQIQERVKELSGLYQIYRLTQTETQIDTLAQAAAELLAGAMREPQEVYVTVEVDGSRWTHGNQQADGEQVVASIDSSSSAPLARLSIRFSRRMPALEEERQMLDAAALALELWLRDERAQAQLETYEHIVANTQDQIALVDEQLRFKVVNAAYAARLGLKPEELEGRYLRDTLFEDDFSSLLEPNLKKALNGSAVQFQQWRSAPNGQRMYMNVLYTPYEEHRGVRGVIASVHDISSLYKAEEKLRRAAQVFNSSAEAVLMTDVKGNITDANEAFAEITGYSVDEVLGRNASIIRSDRHPQSFYDEIFNSIRSTGRWRGEIWSRRRNGELVPCLTTVARVLSDWGELNGYVGVFSDISNIKDNEHRLELLAHHDPLTGLSNRTQLSRSLQNRISRARSEEQSFTLMFIDLDHFKDINDALGHSAGDALLQLAGERLLGVLRDDDVLARVGGDEFVVMLQCIETAQNASTIATKIIEALKQTFSIAGNEVHISASVGICCYPEDGSDAETLLRNADTAMYEAKSAGRGTWRCYSQEMTEAAQRHMTLLAALRQARARGELYLVYQPKFDAHSEALSGFEALLRWRHAGLGAVNTQEFILVAEQAGLISELDYWVLDEVCSQINGWRQQGLNPPRIAVNISARTLHDTCFIATVSKLLTDHQISSDSIQLELTESALLPGVDGANKALSQIRELGLGIAVDDFGTGYSSLSYLRTLPVTELKIDASFVRDVVSSPDAATIAETIFAMAKSLKLEVVAEGVETRAQLDFLRNLGPLQIQGFYLSRPLSVDDTQRLLKKETAA